MRYAQIRDMDISNGEKIGVALFTSGCRFYCKNCFNKELWDVKSGNLWSKEVEDNFLTLAKPDYISRISILGGEPMNPKNIDGTTKLAKAFKEKFPNKNLWAWSGYLFDKDLKDKDVVKYLDVLVDGQYVDELHNPTLKWKGSANQRVIDVQKSLEQNNVVLL